MDKIPVLDEHPTEGKSPVLGTTPTIGKDPVLQYAPGDKRWTFSFRFWNQIEFFGLGSSPQKWFVSLLEKLKELSEKEVEKFISDYSQKSAWRYHHIDWGQKNIPIQRQDITWLAHEYLNNEDDYPILQFQISKSFGRVVGFWDENSIFNIILLDPMHNIQPSKSFAYRVDPCDPLSSEYSSIMSQLDSLKQKNLCKENCGYLDAINQISTNSTSLNVLVHYLSDDEKQELESVMDNGVSYKDIFMYGIEFLKDCNSNEEH